MKIKHISAALAVAVLLPFAASALTTDDIQAQITRLLAQIAQLQQQLKDLQGGTTPVACTQEAKVCPDGTSVGRTGPRCEFAACPTLGVKTLPPVCPIFDRTLYRGLKGDDVTALQDYLGVPQTGFFGPVTEQAVNAVQADAGIAQVGMVGPQTRAWIYKRCGGGGWSQNFSASPTSGAAPLQVTFTATATGGSQGSGSPVSNYSIDFGDGTTGTPFDNSPQPYTSLPGDIAISMRSFPMAAMHTYAQNGTYTAKLMYQPPTPPTIPCVSGAPCATYDQAPARVVGTATITVGGSTTGVNFSATPTSGSAPLGVFFNATNVAKDTTYYISYGDGTDGQMTLNPSPLGACYYGSAGCTISYSASANHTYASAGTFTATLSAQPPFVCNAPPGAACAQVMPARQTLGTVTITVNGSTSGASISVSAPVGGTNVMPGDTLGVVWNSQSAPVGSAVGLWLVKVRPTGGVPLGCADSNDPAVMPCGSENLGLIAANQITSGKFAWSVPIRPSPLPSSCGPNSSAYECIKGYDVVSYPCPLDTPYVCGNSVTAGSYIIVAKLYTPANACLGGLCWPDSKPTYLASSQSGVFTIGGATGGGGAPSITGLDAPTTLSVGQTGTWTVRLNTTNTGNLNYSVVWGDEGWGMVPMDAKMAASPAIAASGIFTHAYQSAGTYSPKFTVSNSSGSAQTSASVVVGGSNICPVYQQPLCPTGYHVGPSTTNANGCSAPGSCIPDATTTNTLSASPTSGSTPLNVNFSYPYNSSTSGGQYTVNFGDGTSGQMSAMLTASLCAFGSDCTQRGSWNANHTYASAGTYTASLMQSSFCALDSTCWLPNTGVPSVTITVTGGGAACGIGGCASWVPQDTYPFTTAPSQGAGAQASTASSVGTGTYWCGAGALSVSQATPCSAR